MKVPRKTLAEITNQAYQVLVKELGFADTIRFINQYTNGHGNYTLERDALFEGVTLDQILHEIKPEQDSESR
jgi:hypothetical protein